MKPTVPDNAVAATTRVVAPHGKRLQAAVLLILWIVVLNQGIAIYLARTLGFGGYYTPWSWLWWQSYYGFATTAFNRAYIVILAGSLAGIAIAVVYLGRQARSLATSGSIHGTAHWATKAEIEKCGLLGKNSGVFVGGWTDPKDDYLHYLRHDGPEHVAALAPTRSGKGVGLVVPTALSWPASMVVNDMKGELWNLTAGWRSQKANNTVLKFDPAAIDGSISFNPLNEVRFGTLNEVGDAQNIATIIVDPDGKGLVDHWAKTSHALLTGLILHILYTNRAQRDKGKGGALYDVAFALSDPSRPNAELWKEMIENRHDTQGLYGSDGLHPVVAASGRDMLNKPANEAGSVISTAMSFLSLYRDPIVRKNTERSDFHIDDLMNAEKPVSLYIIVNADNKDRMKPLMRLILNQIVRVLLRPDIVYKNGRGVMPHKHRLLLLLDEFPSYGKLEVFQEALAYVAGYGIKAYLIMQDIAQLWGAYGKDETITSNCHVRVAYAPNKIETGEWLSKMSGQKTETKIQTTVSGKRFGAIADHFSQMAAESQRPLLTADEAMRLRGPEKGSGDAITAPGDVLVFVAGHAPILGTQSLFFRDPRLLERAEVSPPSSSFERSACASIAASSSDNPSSGNAYDAESTKSREIHQAAVVAATECER